jgi:DNA-binding transcriptional regulator YiaG
MTPEELVKIRKSLGFKTRLTFALAVGVARTTVDNWENGVIPVPQPVVNLLRCWELLATLKLP